MIDTPTLIAFILLGIFPFGIVAWYSRNVFAMAAVVMYYVLIAVIYWCSSYYLGY